MKMRAEPLIFSFYILQRSVLLETEKTEVMKHENYIFIFKYATNIVDAFNVMLCYNSPI